MKKILKSVISVLLFLLWCSSLQAVEQRIVKVGAFHYYPAIFKDTDGVIRGFYVDSLSELGQRENIRFEYVYGSWNDGLERLKSGEVDVLTSVAFTPERAEYMDYTATPLLTVWGELYVPLSSEIDGIREVSGKKIAVMKSDINARHFIELVKKFDISCEFIEMPGFDDVFTSVALKKVDAGVVNSSFGAAKQKVYGLRSTGVVFNPFDIYFTVAKGKNQDLLALLQKNLVIWKHQADSPFTRARQKWSHTSDDTVQAIPIPRWFVYSLAMLAVLTIFSAAFIIMLRRQVHRKTRSIVESAEQYQLLSARQNAILAAVPDIVMEADSSLIYTWSNSAGLDFFGEDVIGKEVGYYFAGTQQTYEIIRPLFNGTQKSLYVESWQRRKDGEIRLLAWWCRSLENEQGVVTGTLSTARDITESKRVEEALKDSQELIAAVVENVPLMIFLKEATELRFVLFNRAGEELLGYDRTALLGKNNLDLFPTEQSEKFMAKDRELLESESGFLDIPEEPVLTANKGLRLLHTRKVCIRGRDGVTKFVLGLSEDITERKLYEKELLAKNTELERFTYTVSHDLKSPLITIQTYAGMINQDLKDGNHARAREDLKRIEDAAAKMSDLLNDLLELSRVGRVMNSSATIDMNRLVREVLEHMAGLLGQSNMEVFIDPNLPQITGDHKRIAEVMQNLIENAVKYMGNQAAPRIEIGARRDGTEDIFYVTDNGRGIDPRYHENIFGLFSKLDVKSEGTGIGLALVRRIIEVHGGRVWVESDGAETGSRFCFTVGQE